MGGARALLTPPKDGRTHDARCHPETGAYRTARFGVAFIGLLLIAVNLRVSFVSVGPVLGNISSDLELSSAAAGFLTGLPLIAFAIFSPPTPGFAFRLGLDRALWMSLLILASGIVLRSLPCARRHLGGNRTDRPGYRVP